MASKLYVGNLSFNTDNAALEAMFTPFGHVQSASIAVDRMTNRGRGFGFVEMETDTEAQAAIAALDGQQADGRTIKVNVAKPREDRGGSRGGFGGGNRRY